MRCSSLTLRRMSSVVVPAGGGRVFPQSAPTRSRTREASVCSGFLPSGSSRSFLREEAVKMCAPAWPASIQSNKNVALSCLDFTCSSCLNYMFECSQLRENKWFHVQVWHKCWLPDTSCTKRRKKLPANWISVESCFTRVRKLFHQSHKQNRLGRPSSGERVAANIFCCLVLQSHHICHFFRYTFQNVRFNTKYNYCLNCSLLLLLKPAWKTFRIWVSTH